MLILGEGLAMSKVEIKEPKNSKSKVSKKLQDK
jgi:hypothetical protein